ncbi:uncharacterized protein LOC114526800 [Dendronephthya gigantea]|uniref:uncharacterized protein LOC114526800 n=1 Tax=Dendronephthya gigantea TaxID=151771 RepID=UPI001069BF90|nr:uncharacterized protein LOC114526800 [Dendronephthya gigantea]
MTNRVLPLGFTSIKNPPNPNRKCDLISCERVNPLWNVFRGCGHSFHIECLLPNISNCPVCEATLLSSVQDLGTTANNAVFTPATYFEPSEDENDEQSDDSDSDVGETEDEQNKTTVDELLRKINLWQRPSSALL